WWRQCRISTTCQAPSAISTPSTMMPISPISSPQVWAGLGLWTSMTGRPRALRLLRLAGRLQVLVDVVLVEAVLGPRDIFAVAGEAGVVHGAAGVEGLVVVPGLGRGHAGEARVGELDRVLHPGPVRVARAAFHLQQVAGLDELGRAIQRDLPVLVILRRAVLGPLGVVDLAAARPEGLRRRIDDMAHDVL